MFNTFSAVLRHAKVVTENIFKRLANFFFLLDLIFSNMFTFKAKLGRR